MYSRDEFNNIYQEIWIGYLCILLPIFLINFLVLILTLFSSLLNRAQNLSIIKYLCLEDFLFTLIGVIQACVNLGYTEMDTQRCRSQLAVVGFFVPTIGYTLCLLVYNIDLKTRDLHTLKSKKIFFIHLSIWILALLNSISTAYLLEPDLVNSYCNFTLIEYKSGSLFYTGSILLPTIYLTYKYIDIYRYLKNNNTKAPYSIFIYLVSYYLCHFPGLIISVLEVATNSVVDIEVHLVANYLVRLGSLMNPILYFWLDPENRTIFCHHWNKIWRKNRIIDIRAEDYKLDPTIIQSLKAPLMNNYLVPPTLPTSPESSDKYFYYFNQNTP